MRSWAIAIIVSRDLWGDRFDVLSCKIGAIADSVVLFVANADIFG